MEGKSCIFKQMGGVDVVPISIQEKDPKKLIDIIASLAPVFSAITLEDIKAPDCFLVEDTLKGMLDIPVFHDD
jgi:malate dehydrogenase (oxaloacetate-decarboxylating)(NADP+)